MNIQRIIDILRMENTTVRLYFTRKRGINYISYSPTMGADVQSDIKSHILSYIEGFLNTEQVEFSPLGYREDTVETCNIEYISNYTDVIDSYLEGNLNREIPEDIINKLNFYCLIIEFNEGGVDKEIKLFRRVTKFKKLSTKGMMGWIENNRFNKLDASLIGVDGLVDIVVDGNEILILNHIALERIFSISDQYSQKAQQTINSIRELDRITNFDQFEEDALNDRRITRTLTKLLSEEERLEKCFENFSNVIDVVEIFELDINIENVDGVEKIVYESKEQLMDIIRLVRDSYYTSIMNNRNGIDDSI
ncbi:MAG: Kiwa anti-phage protein KwaB-like domain-containing protein [Clostridium sp.]